MPFEIEVPIRFHHADAAGIMFFANSFVLAHDAYEGFVKELGLDFSTWFESDTMAAPIRHAEAEYFQPLRAGDTVSITVNVEHVGISSFKLSYTFTTPKGLHSRITLVHACLDIKKGAKMDLPEDVRRKLLDFHEAANSTSMGVTPDTSQ